MNITVQNHKLANGIMITERSDLPKGAYMVSYDANTDAFKMFGELDTLLKILALVRSFEDFQTAVEMLKA